jgi:hypothetical protein
MGVVVNSELLLDDDGRDPDVLPEGVYPAGVEIPADRVLLFEVNQRQYTGPKRVDQRIVFQYLRSVRRDADSAVAMADLLYGALGEAVIDVLATEQLDPEEFQQVMKVVERYVFGAMDSTLGNSRAARRR